MSQKLLFCNCESPKAPVVRIQSTLAARFGKTYKQRFSLIQWFAAGALSCRLRKTDSGHCYLRISPDFQVNKRPLQFIKHILLLKHAGRKLNLINFYKPIATI